MPCSLRIEISVQDVNASVRFYVDTLGFAIAVDRRAEAQPSLELERDAVRIAVVGRPGEGLPQFRRPPTGIEIVLEVDFLHAERDRLRLAGWIIDEDIQRRPSGLQDFRAFDPDGYYIRFTHRRR